MVSVKLLSVMNRNGETLKTNYFGFHDFSETKCSLLLKREAAELGKNTCVFYFFANQSLRPYMG